jgi:hypothetical protein
MARTTIKGEQIGDNEVTAKNMATGSINTAAYASGSIVNAHLAGSIANAKLSNSSVAYGGVSLSLGGTDATPAFNLSDASALPASGVTGATFGAGTYSFNGSTISDLGTVTTANIDGGNIDGTIIGATGVAAGSFAAVIGTTGVYSGILKTDDTTEATSTTDGSLQTDGGLSVAKSAVIGDDLDLLSDGAIVNIGSTSKFTLTDQAANNCVMAASGARLAFGNAGEYISGDGTDLDIISSGDLDITATLVDVTGALTVSGTTTASGRLLVDDTTDAASKTDGSLQTDGGLSVAKKAYVGTGLTVEAGGVTVTAGGVEVDAGAVNIDDTTAASSKTTGALKVAGGISSQLKGHFGTGLTTDSGGLTVTAGGVEVSAGRVVIDDTTAASSTTDGALACAGGLSVAADAIIGDDVKLLSDSAVLSMGLGSDATFTHDGTTGLTIAATPITVNSTGDLTLDSSADVVLSADGGNVKMDDGTTTVFDFNTDDPELKIMDDAQVANYCSLAVGANGATTLTTVDADAAAANLIVTADGTVDIDSAGLMTLDSGAAINIEPAVGSAILLDGTISIDAGVVTGATSITSTAFVGTLSTAAQPNITSLGTIASLVATTADINAGTVDAVVGGTTPAAGTFTTLVGGTSLALASGATVTAILDEDDMTSDSATALATQQSIKAYVDAVAQGLDLKESCLRATSANLSGSTYANGSSGVGATITCDSNLALVVDGSGPIATSSRILVKDMSTAAENGIYTVTTAGNGSTPYVLTRATDFNTSAKMDKGSFVFVEAGTDNADAGFVMTQDSAITVGTTDIDWTQFSGAGSVTAGNGLAKSGNTLSLALSELSAVGPQVGADSLALVDNSDSNASKVTTIANLAGAMVNGSTGLSATSGVLSVKMAFSDECSNTQYSGDFTRYDTSYAGIADTDIDVYVNGLLQREGASNDYQYDADGGTGGVGKITFISANSSDDIVMATYPRDNS